MVYQTGEIIFMAILSITVVALWLALGCYLLDCWPDTGGQNNSEYRIDESRDICCVTNEAKEFCETTKSHEEGQTPIIASLLNDQYIV